MKKTFLKVVGVLALTALALVSCKQPTTEYSGSVDTVLSLDTPVVKAKAYPGMNYVSWNPVRGAAEYEVSVYADGNFSFKETAIVDNQFVHAFSVRNGVKYTYKVEAVSTSDPSREVVVRNSKIGEASCTAIMPPVDTKAADLAAYEGGYDGKKAKTLSKDEAKKALAVTIANGSTYMDNYFYDDVADENYPMSNIRFSWNQKAYLKYNYAIVAGDKSFLLKDEFTYNNGHSTLTANPEYNNKTAYDIWTVTSAGKYSLGFMIEAQNYEFAPSYVTFEDFFEVPLFVGSTETDNLKAAWIDAGKTARVMWTPCVLEDDITLGAVADYKVYREVNNKPGALVEVNGIKADKVAGEVYYYVDDPAASADLTNTYYVVYSKDGRFEATNKTVDLGAYTTISGYAAAPLNAVVGLVDYTFDGFENNAIIYLKLDSDTTLSAAKYAIVGDDDLAAIDQSGDPEDFDYAYLFSVDSVYTNTLEFTNCSDTEFYWIVKDEIPNGKYVVAYFEIAQEEKNNYVVIASSDEVDTTGTAAAPTLNISPKANEADRINNDFDITLTLDSDDEEIVSIKYAYGETPTEAELNAVKAGTEIKVATPNYCWTDTTGKKGYKFTLDNKELGAHYAECFAVVAEVKEAGKTNYVASAWKAIDLNDRENRISVDLNTSNYSGTTRSVELTRADNLYILNTTTGSTTTYKLMDDVADYTITAEYAVVPKTIANFTEIDVWSPVTLAPSTNPSEDSVTTYCETAIDPSVYPTTKGSPIITGVEDDQWVVVKYTITYKYGTPSDGDLADKLNDVFYLVNKY